MGSAVYSVHKADGSLLKDKSGLKHIKATAAPERKTVTQMRLDQAKVHSSGHDLAQLICTSSNTITPRCQLPTHMHHMPIKFKIGVDN